MGRCERVGSANGRALRSVSDRLLAMLAVACSMLRERTPYDRQHRAARLDGRLISARPAPRPRRNGTLLPCAVRRGSQHEVAAAA